MTQDRWADLRARAAEATPNWTRPPLGLCISAHVIDAAGLTTVPVADAYSQNDAAYIAAASPAAVLALLAERDALRAVLTACRHELYDLSHSSGDPSDPANMESTAMLYREVCAALAAGEDAP